MGTYLFPPTRPRGRGRGARGWGRARGSSRAQPRGRGRGRGRGRSAPQAMQPSRGVGAGRAGDTIINSEALVVGDANKVVTLKFSPGLTGLPILDSQGNRFTRFHVNYVNIAYCATDSTTASGEITWGIAGGNAMPEIKAMKDILALRPFKKHATWKSESVAVGRGIMPSTWLYCNEDSRDGVAFTMYYHTTKSSGVFKISYSVKLDYPNPIPGTSQLCTSLSNLLLESQRED